MKLAAPAPPQRPHSGLPRVDAAGCGFCGSSEAEPAVDGVGDWFFGCVAEPSDFVRCTQCGSLWQPRPLAPKSLPAAYAEYYTHAEEDGDLLGGSARARLRGRYARRMLCERPSIADRFGGALFAAISRDPGQLEAALRFVPRAPARVLDYGCGSGLFLRRLREFGHEVEGVDFDPVAVSAVRASGIACRTPDEVPDDEWRASFDAITLSHVIEHVPDPRALLGQLASWLKPGGSLFIECPNANATGLALFGRYWRGLEAPRHLAIPSPDGLERALDEAGLAVSRRIVRAGVREWVWADSLAVVPEQIRAAIRGQMTDAPPETLTNAEFITLTARKIAA